MKCEICGKEATEQCEWGLYERNEPMNIAFLCSNDSSSLYDKCRGAINSLLMHWASREISTKSVPQPKQKLDI